MVLKDFIAENKTFALKAHADDWKAAVKIGTDLLVKAGAVEERYYDAVIDIAEEHGPYYVIVPGIAMPHARPELGAIKTGFALVTLDAPVEFHSENDPVRFILCISAKDAADLNGSVIIEAMTLFENEEAIERLCKTTDEKEMFEILNEVEASLEE